MSQDSQIELLNQSDVKPAKLFELVTRFQQLQRGNGSIDTGQLTTAKGLLNQIKNETVRCYAAFGQFEMAKAFVIDLATWQHKGLGTSPQFDHSRDVFASNRGGCPTLFVGPIRAVNAPRDTVKLEAFKFRVDVPDCLRVLELKYPNQSNYCETVKIVAGSPGLLNGNCIVFFPENVNAQLAPRHQSFGLFLMNKFHQIYHNQTIPLVFQCVANVPSNYELSSCRLDPNQCYEARCVWAFMHEYFHNQGTMPLCKNLETKLASFPGILEELKVDCQVFVEAAKGNLPFSMEIMEMILFERLIRYPRHGEAESNIDAATGVLLATWLRKTGVVRIGSHRMLRIIWHRVAPSLFELINLIERTEKTSSRANYSENARKIVSQFLELPRDQSQLFHMPKWYSSLGQSGKLTSVHQQSDSIYK